MGLEPSSQDQTLTHDHLMRYTIHVPTPSGVMAPFPIDAESPDDLRRQARRLFLHVWDRIVWPDGLEPKSPTRADRPSR